jgi:hypothetical protein
MGGDDEGDALGPILKADQVLGVMIVLSQRRVLRNPGVLGPQHPDAPRFDREDLAMGGGMGAVEDGRADGEHGGYFAS